MVGPFVAPEHGPLARYPPGISTRKLIIAALLCGLAILVASSLQLILLTR